MPGPDCRAGYIRGEAAGLLCNLFAIGMIGAPSHWGPFGMTSEESTGPITFLALETTRLQEPALPSVPLPGSAGAV